MNDTALYESTVPVLLHYLYRIEAILSGLHPESHSMLEHRLSDHAFTAAEHLHTAIGFAERTVYPLLGRELAESESVCTDCECLLELARDAASFLDKLTTDDFAGVSDRVIKHSAGMAELEQDATTFVTLFALPNFFFHLTTAFSILRSQGADIGKADFDGLHRYARDFHF